MFLIAPSRLPSFPGSSRGGWGFAARISPCRQLRAGEKVLRWQSPAVTSAQSPGCLRSGGCCLAFAAAISRGHFLCITPAPILSIPARSLLLPARQSGRAGEPGTSVGLSLGSAAQRRGDTSLQPSRNQSTVPKGTGQILAQWAQTRLSPVAASPSKAALQKVPWPGLGCLDAVTGRLLERYLCNSFHLWGLGCPGD